AGADAALLWAPDALHPSFLCIAAFGAGTERAARRSVSRETGLVHDLVRDRVPVLLQAEQLTATEDPFLKAIPTEAGACLFVPLQAERIVVGLLALAFHRMPDRGVLQNLQGFLKHATPALARALRAERKTSGMLYAIERLTSLYDLTKAFGSTIDLAELSAIIARKAADFMSAEVASLWTLDRQAGELTLAATAVNANYDIPASPEAVGGSVVGDVLAGRTPLRRNDLPEDDPVRTENPDYPVHSILAAPLIEDDEPIGVIVVVNKRGRHPEFTAADEDLLVDIERQAVRALHNARQYEAEKKVAELDALLTVSREITSTLDLDKVMNAIVNSTAALIRYDRCAIGIQDRGRLRLGAVSGVLELDRSRPDLKRTTEILEWVHGGGTDVSVVENEDGTLETARPETTEKFRAFFAENKLKSFYGILLKDEEGPLGVLGFESSERLVFDEETRSLLQILVNQATVAVRNAQLYRQVPLVGFLKPLLSRKKKLMEIPRSRRVAWGVSALVALIVLFLVPWRLRLTGAARVVPGRRASVTAGVDGIVATVVKLEGDAVVAGDVIATLEDEAYRAALAEARSALQIASSDLARARDAGNAAAAFDAESRRNELVARMALEDERLSRTRLVAPVAGVIVTPRIQERVGQNLAKGAELCVVADVATVTAEVAVPEEDAALLAPGQRAGVKLHPYPTRTFQGQVTRVGAQVREEGKDRFVVAEVALENADGLLKTGMLGQAKIVAHRSNIATLLLRRPARWLYGKLWPLLP
ncbi:MAG: GAF domain-containing protein, partial [Thermoanaerobaculia bacterium]|nr:GAF domain-containing protein [Thermoanaerobaculia bacterium]